MRVRHLVLALAALAAAGCHAHTGEPPVTTAGGVAARGGAQSAPVPDEDERRRQFAACMHEQGVELAAPGAERLEPPVTGPEAERAAAVLERCRVHLPGGGVPPPLTPADIDEALAHAQCMRDNGVAYFPDPDPETGRPELTTELGDRLKRDPQRAVADEQCRHLIPAIGGSGANG